ncbi:hypothetical protein QOT17_009731 [Balamuthia mandrillaris]
MPKATTSRERPPGAKGGGGYSVERGWTKGSSHASSQTMDCSRFLKRLLRHYEPEMRLAPEISLWLQAQHAMYMKRLAQKLSQAAMQTNNHSPTADEVRAIALVGIKCHKHQQRNPLPPVLLYLLLHSFVFLPSFAIPMELNVLFFSPSPHGDITAGNAARAKRVKPKYCRHEGYTVASTENLLNFRHKFRVE